MPIRTWHAEMAVVALVLVAVAIASGGWLELVGAGAVILSFGHAQVAERLAERDAARERPSVSCHRWATRYLVGKEALWCAYFVLHGSWSALAGVALFLAYPAWRRWWRSVRPLITDEQIKNLWRQPGNGLTGRDLMAALNEPMWDGHSWTDDEVRAARSRCAEIHANQPATNADSGASGATRDRTSSP